VPSTHNDGKQLATVSMISTCLQMSVSVPPQAAGMVILNTPDHRSASTTAVVNPRSASAACSRTIGSISLTRAKIAASSSTA